MAAKTVIFLLFILQVNGYFLGDLAGAISSVESAFGKLLNDFVSDVENTVHCTMLAMEQVLTMSGAVNEASNYNCYANNNSVDNNNELPLDNLQSTTERDNYSNYSKEDIIQQISSSISNVNNTLINILDNDGHERINHVKSVLKNETDRFTEVSRLLREELGKISDRLRNEHEIFDTDNSSLESLWKEIKILHDVEENDKNDSEVKEISKVLNEALDVLQVEAGNNVKSDEDKMETIMRKLEHESNNNSTTISNIDMEMAQWKERRLSLQNYSEDTRNSSKIIGDKGNNTNEISNLKTEDHVSRDDKVKSVDSNFFSLFGEASKEDEKKTINEAKNIIEDSIKTEQMLDDFFAKQEQSAVDVFGNPKQNGFGS